METLLTCENNDENDLIFSHTIAKAFFNLRTEHNARERTARLFFVELLTFIKNQSKNKEICEFNLYGVIICIVHVYFKHRMDVTTAIQIFETLESIRITFTKTHINRV